MNENIKKESDLSPYMLDNWKNIVNLMTNMMNVTAGFITQISGTGLKILQARARSDVSLEEGDVLDLSEVYCQEVINKNEKVEIEDARRIDKWKGSAELEEGFVSYLGVPINFPTDNDIFGTLCVVDKKPRDFTAAEKNLLLQLKKSVEDQMELIQASLDTLAANIIVIDKNGVITYANDAWRDFINRNSFWFSRGSRGDNYLKIIKEVTGDDRQYAEEILQKIKKVLQGNKNKFTLEIPCWHEQEKNWYRINISASHKQRIRAVVISYEDITEHKEQKQKIELLLYRDQLTDVFNRRFLKESIPRINVEKNLPISVIKADINGLKIVNDSLGYEKGDEIIIETAQVIKDVIRDKDILARYGGDEFIVILPKTERSRAAKVSRQLKEFCHKTRENNLHISLGTGVATKKTTEKSIEEIFQKADDRMYRDKIMNNRSQKHKIVQSLLDALGAKSYETKEHAMRMTDLAYRLGQKLRVTDKELNKLSLLATLHDVGKTSIPEEILTKPGGLNDQEWEKIKEHPERGFKIASASQEFAALAEEILAHHERWDGGGYPRGLEGEEIPFLARIITIVDAFDVMTHERPYSAAMSNEEALQEIKQGASTQFDPNISRAFIELMSGKKIAINAGKEWFD